MSVDLVAGNAVHYPKRRDVFEFDAEVSSVFPDMALRSIPMYKEVHRLHVSMLYDTLAAQDVVIYDIGASRGHFFKEVCNRFQLDPKKGRDGLRMVAVDSSPHMLDALAEELPCVSTVCTDARELIDFEVKADVICLFYILQFLEHDSEKLDVLRWAHRNLKPGGIVLIGQKGTQTETYQELFDTEYYRFRLANGYTWEEIQAKTLALKNSMWPCSPAWLESLCIGAGFIDYVETTRWLQFSTSMCTKGVPHE